MARRSKAQMREIYSKKLGEDLVANLSDDQISILSKYYNSLDAKETSEVDSKIIQGSNDTVLHEMARNMVDEEEIEAPSDEEIDKKFRDYHLEQRKKELTEKISARTIEKNDEEEDIPEGLDDLLSSIQEESPVEAKATTIKSDSIVPAKFFGEDRYDKYYNELITEGRIEGENLSPDERKEGMKSYRKGKIDFETFVNKVLKTRDEIKKQEQDILPESPASAIVKRDSVDIEKFKTEPVSEGTQQNFDDILNGIDSILETLREENKLKKKESNKERLKDEERRRKKKEEKLEKNPFKKLGGVVDRMLKPVKSLWERIWDFIWNVFLGRTLMKLIDWFSDDENKGKLEAIGKFLEKTWPILLASYLLFGNSMGRFITSMSAKIIKWTVQLGVMVAKQLIPLAKKLGWKKGAAVVGLGVAGISLAGRMMGGGEDDVDSTQTDGGQKSSPDTPANAEDGDSDRDPEKLKDGGIVPGSGPNKDTIPAMLSPGEFVMSRGAVQKYGTDTLESMNAAGGGNNKPKIKDGTVYANKGGHVGTKPEKNRQPAERQADVPVDGGGEGEGLEPARNIITTSHRDTGSGYGIKGVNDGQGRPAVFSKGGAIAFAKMMKDSDGKVIGSDITSSQRSKAKNASLPGAAPNSNHLYGNALDIHGGSQKWMRKHGPKYGWKVQDYSGSHGGHFNYGGPGSEERGGGGSLVLTGKAKNLIGNDTVFLEKVKKLSAKYQIHPADLLGKMASESGLDPAADNGTHVGLIQFSKDSAAAVGTTQAALKKMTRGEQMEYVEKYFDLWKLPKGASPGHLYTISYLPAFAKQSANYVLAKRGGFTDSLGHHPSSWYDNNAGLDQNNDGQITIAELGERIQKKKKEFGIGGGGGGYYGGGGGGGGGLSGNTESNPKKNEGSGGYLDQIRDLFLGAIGFGGGSGRSSSSSSSSGNADIRPSKPAPDAGDANDGSGSLPLGNMKLGQNSKKSAPEPPSQSQPSVSQISETQRRRSARRSAGPQISPNTNDTLGSRHPVPIDPSKSKVLGVVR